MYVLCVCFVCALYVCVCVCVCVCVWVCACVQATALPTSASVTQLSAPALSADNPPSDPERWAPVHSQTELTVLAGRSDRSVAIVHLPAFSFTTIEVVDGIGVVDSE